MDLTGICAICWGSLEQWTGPSCARCGLPILSEHALATAVVLCGQCRNEEFSFDLARSYGLYSGGLRGAILLLKFQRRERLGRRLGEILASLWGTVREHCDGEEAVLVPVPLYPSRQRERGFNQAELLARGISHRLAGSSEVHPPQVEARCLRRTRATRPQAGLSLQARLENVRGVFEVTSPGSIRSRVAILVDDVFTTGATLSSCATTLKDVGAQRVMALTLARATPQTSDNVTLAPALPVDEPHNERT